MIWYVNLNELLENLVLVVGSGGGMVERCVGVECGLGVVRQSACLVLGPIAVYGCGFLFNCTMVGQASDSMTALT